MSVPASEVATEQYRRRLEALRAATLRQTIRLYPTWQGDDDSFPVIVAAFVLISRLRRLDAARAAAAFYGLVRPAGIPFLPILAPETDAKLVDALYLEGLIRKKKAVRRSVLPEQARKDALVRMSSTMLRSVDMAARDTIQETVFEDPKALGFNRRARVGACDYCKERAGRVLTTAEDNGFHKNCSCVVIPVFGDD